MGDFLRRRKPHQGVQWQAGAPETPFVIGHYGPQQISLTEMQQQQHVLVVGPTGTGKSSGLIIPGLLSELGSRQVMAIDPKGELMHLTVGALAQRHRVSVFAPTNPVGSDCYNPLAYVRSGDYAYADASDIAECWIQNTGESKGEPFWDNMARLLITAVILHVKAVYPDAPFCAVSDMFLEMGPEDIQAALWESPSQSARNTARAFLEGVMGNDRLKGSIQSDLPIRFQRMASEHLRQVTSRHQIDFTNMSGQPGALFLCIPAYDAERLQPLSALFLMHMFRAWSEDQYHSKVAYLDEFANVGHIPKMNRYISMLRSSRSALMLAIQNHKQLEAIYQEHHADTILSNCTTHLVLPGAGQHECEYYSRRVGTATVIAHGFSRTEAQQNSYAYSQSQVQRPLMTPDEIRTMRRGEILMVSGNAKPLIVRNTPYYQHSWLASRVDLPYARPARRVEPPPPPRPRLLRSSRPMPSVRITEIAEPRQGAGQRLLGGPQTARQRSASDGTRWDPDRDDFPLDW